MIRTSQKATLTAQWVVLSAGFGADGVEYGKQCSYDVSQAMFDEVVTLYRTFHAAFAPEQASFPEESLWYWSMRDGTQVVTIVERKQEVGRVALHYVSLLFSKDVFEARIGTPYLPYSEGWHRGLFQKTRNVDRREIEITLPPKIRKKVRMVDFAEWNGDNDYSQEALMAWRKLCADIVKEGGRIPYFADVKKGGCIPYFAEWWPNKERATRCFKITFRHVVEDRWTLDTALSKAKEACRKLESLLPGDKLIEEANLLINAIQGLGNRVDSLSKDEWKLRLDTASENAGRIGAGLSPNSSSDTRIRELQADYQAFSEAVRHIRQPGAGTKQRVSKTELYTSDTQKRARLKIPRLKIPRLDIPPLAKIALVIVTLIAFTGVMKWRNRQRLVPPVARPLLTAKPTAKKVIDFDFLNEMTRKYSLLEKVQHGNLGLPEFMNNMWQDKKHGIAGMSPHEIVRGKNGSLREQMKYKILLDGLFDYIKTHCLKDSQIERVTLDTLYARMVKSSDKWTEKYKFIRKECGEGQQDGFDALLNGCIGTVKVAMNRKPDTGTQPEIKPITNHKKKKDTGKVGKKPPKPPPITQSDDH